MASNKLWSTGVHDNGTLLAPGSIDPHWMLIQGPGITTPQKVYVLANPPGAYFPAMATNSGWVWADPSGMGDPSAPYVFETKFYLEVNLSRYWIAITGKWGADNFGEFMIDGTALPLGAASGEVSLPPGNQLSNYNQPHPFSISQAHFGSPSQLQLSIGWHAFQVSVYNEGQEAPDNPAGLNVGGLHIGTHPALQHWHP